MEILRKIIFYAFLVLLPLELICVIISLIKRDHQAEILRRLRLIASTWIVLGLYFGSMIL